MNRLVTLTDEDIELIKSIIDMHPEVYSSGVKIKKKLEKSQNRIKIASAKNKGRSYQYDICEWVSKLLNIPFNQQDDDCEIHSREMSQSGTDIIFRGNARKLFPFDIEAKSTKELNIHSAIEQADKNASEDRLGVVFYKQTNMKPFVAFSMPTFEKLCKRFILS